MSWQALAWAAKCRVASAAEKLMLLAYADRHNEETGCAYPSIAWLCQFSSLNRKTVVAAVGRLEAAGLVSDSGERKGETKQIKVYRLNLDSTGIGTVPKTEPSLKRNSTEKGVKQSQKRDTEPVRTSPPNDLSDDRSSPIIDLPIDSEPIQLKPEHVVEAWNDTAVRVGLPKAKLTPERRKRIASRLRQHPIEDWTEAIAAIERSPFLRGENDRAWRATFDFLLQPSSFTKLIEGTYDRPAH